MFMKMLLTCFLLSLVAKGLAEEPKALANARSIYESELAKAQKQMEADYLATQRDHLTSHIAVLESYKQDAMKSGNLEEAILYDKEIKRVGDPFNEPTKPQEKASFLEGAWILSASGGRKHLWVFGKNVVQVGCDKRAKWTRQGDEVTAHWDSGWWDKMKINPDKPDVMEGRNKAGEKLVWNRLKLYAPADNKGGEIEPPAPRKSNAFQLDGKWERRNLRNGGKALLTFKDNQVMVNNDPLIISREDGFFKCRSATSGWWFTCKPDPNNLDVMTGMRKNGDKLIFTRVK
jgi:hypothetical protein